MTWYLSERPARAEAEYLRARFDPDRGWLEDLVPHSESFVAHRYPMHVGLSFPIVLARPGRVSIASIVLLADRHQVALVHQGDVRGLNALFERAEARGVDLPAGAASILVAILDVVARTGRMVVEQYRNQVEEVVALLHAGDPSGYASDLTALQAEIERARRTMRGAARVMGRVLAVLADAEFGGHGEDPSVRERVLAYDRELEELGARLTVAARRYRRDRESRDSAVQRGLAGFALAAATVALALLFAPTTLVARISTDEGGRYAAAFLLAALPAIVTLWYVWRAR